MSELDADSVEVLVHGDRLDRAAMARALDLSRDRLRALELPQELQALVPASPLRDLVVVRAILASAVVGVLAPSLAGIGWYLLHAVPARGPLLVVELAVVFALPFLLAALVGVAVFQRRRRRALDRRAQRTTARSRLEQQAFVLRDERGELVNLALPRQALADAARRLDRLRQRLDELPAQLQAGEALYTELADLPGEHAGGSGALHQAMPRAEQLLAEVRGLDQQREDLERQLARLEQGRVDLRPLLDGIRQGERSCEALLDGVGLEARVVRGSGER